MQPTDELYEKHAGILLRAAKGTLQRCWNRYSLEGAGISLDDLISVGNEKWMAIVRDWPGEDGLDLHRFLATSCRHIMIDYLLYQYRRAKHQVVEGAALSLPDDDEPVGDGAIDMAEVNALPGPAKDAVMRSLGLVEDVSGNVTGGAEPPRGRLSIPDTNVRERARIRDSVRLIVNSEEG